MAKLIKDLEQSYSVIYAVTAEFHERNTPKPNQALWEQIKQIAVAGKKILDLIRVNNPTENTLNSTVTAQKAARQVQPSSSSTAVTEPGQTAATLSTR